jgi:hypothetical protein
VRVEGRIQREGYRSRLRMSQRRTRSARAKDQEKGPNPGIRRSAVGLRLAWSGFFFNSSGTLLRFVDANGDGVADGPGQVMYTEAIGVWTGLRVAGNLVVVVSVRGGSERITVLRMNGGPATPYTLVGALSFAFPAGWEHKS